MSTSAPSRPTDLPWHIVGRWQEYEGEERANLLRILGIGAFYAVELTNRHGLHLGILELPAVEGVDASFHRAITALVVAWTMLALGVHLCLRQRFFPSALKYVSTALDITFLSMILTVADGPRSPLVIGYFLLIALSALRFSLPLVQGATVGSMGAYLVVCGYARWFTTRDLRVPRYQQIIMLLALGLTGIVLGQILRRVRALAADYAERVRNQS